MLRAQRQEPYNISCITQIMAVDGWNCKRHSFVITVAACLILFNGEGAGARKASTGARKASTESEKSLERTAGELQMFVEKLPTMPVLKGYKTTRDGRFVPGNLTIGMYMKKWKFHRDLPPSTVYAYGNSKRTATVPGPTIWAVAGVPTYILWENHLPPIHIFAIDATIAAAKPASGRGIPTVVHLHGSISEPASDGGAEAWFTADFAEKGPDWKKSVYTYHNVKDVAANLWYHDHALGYTRLNLLAGLVGAYSIRNPCLEARLGRLPSMKFDRHLVVFDKSFSRDGAIYINATGNNPDIHPEWQPEYFGNVVIVNGKAWPHMKVQRRKYRFRIINSSNARFYQFALSNNLSFTQIGADSFYLERPMAMESILVAPSEIVDVIVDFSMCAKSESVLMNSAPFPYPDGDKPDNFSGQVMKFIIKAAPVRDKSVVPAQLVPLERLEKPVVARNIVLYEFDSPSDEPMHLLMNFREYNDPVTETPRIGTVEMWRVINLTPDNHPFHVHLAPFQVITQQALIKGDDLAACVGARQSLEACGWPLDYLNESAVVGPPANEAGWKNVFKMQPMHVTSILIRFSLFGSAGYPFDATAQPGYAYHCHILDHEDNSMMRPFKVIH